MMTLHDKDVAGKSLKAVVEMVVGKDSRIGDAGKGKRTILQFTTLHDTQIDSRQGGNTSS
jgi:hypothetical protein